MSDGMPGWAAWGSLAEEQLAGEAEALLRESRRAPVDRRRVEALLDLYGQRYETLSGHLKLILDEIEVEDYVPDWVIAIKRESVKHAFFVAETKGSMNTLDLRPIEQAKVACAKKLFNEMGDADVHYDVVDSFQKLLGIVGE